MLFGLENREGPVTGRGGPTPPASACDTAQQPARVPFIALVGRVGVRRGVVPAAYTRDTASVAQLVELPTFNRKRAGSSPAGGTQCSTSSVADLPLTFRRSVAAFDSWWGDQSGVGEVGRPRMAHIHQIASSNLAPVTIGRGRPLASRA